MNLSKDVFANVHSVETFGAFDGPGIRYVLFLQGCPFQCQYCHNRDTWTTSSNKMMTVDDVLREYQKYSHFYKKGGITVSGGEPLLQIGFLTELFKKAKEKNIHTCIDTSGGSYHVRNDEIFHELLKYTDLILLDIKHIDDQKHLALTKSSNKQVLSFAKLLDSLNKSVIIRHVLVPTLTDDESDLKKLRLFLDSLTNVIKIEVLPYHKVGIKKWNELGFKYELDHIEEPNQALIDQVEHILKDNYKYAISK